MHLAPSNPRGRPCAPYFTGKTVQDGNKNVISPQETLLTDKRKGKERARFSFFSLLLVSLRFGNVKAILLFEGAAPHVFKKDFFVFP